MGSQSSAPVAQHAPATNDAQVWSHGLVNPIDISNSNSNSHPHSHASARRWSGSTNMSNDVGNNEFSNTGHVPHPICKY